MAATLLIAGATGLIGSAVVEQAARDQRVTRVITWGRHRSTLAPPQFEHWGPEEGEFVKGLKTEHVDAVICCLGTTMRNVKGDKAAFRYVDHDLVLALGQWASGKGTAFCVVSSLGADPHSMFFYNRVKGEVENGLRSMDFSALHLFRPSVLSGPRHEKRMGEHIALRLMTAVQRFLPPAQRPMPHDMLASALLNAAHSDSAGVYTHTYASIRELADQKFTT